MQIEQVWTDIENALYSHILQQVKDPDDAKDILQEVFLKMRRHLNQLRDERKVESWLFRIAGNAVTDHYRRIQRQQRVEGVEQEKTFTVEQEREQFTRRLASWLPEAIDLLPEKYRQAVYLTEIEGLSQKELAERLGLSYSGAKSRVQRGREKLKDIILDCCDVAADRYGNILDYSPRRCRPGEE